MRKNTFNRMLSLVLATVMCLGLFTGCANQNGKAELGKLFGINADTNNTTANSETTTPDATQQDADCSKELAELKAKLDAANASIKELEESNAALTAELNAEANPFILDEEGKPVAINLEDAEELLRVEMANGTYAYRMGKGTPIDVIDEVVLKNGKPYAEQTFELAHHYGSIYVITGVDANGKVQVLQMVYGNKLYAYNKSWAQPKNGEGFKLVETKKMAEKVDIAQLFASAICVYEDADSPFGYSLCLNTTGEYVAPSKPAPSQPENKPVEQPKEEPTDKPSVEEPIEKPSDDKPNRNPDDSKKPENNPPMDETEDVRPGEGPDDMDNDKQPENNPEIDETEDVLPDEGPADMKENNPPADQDDESELPSDMNDSCDDNAPADMKENAPSVDTTVDMNAPADMQENSPPVEDDATCVTVEVTFDAPVDCNINTNDEGPADIGFDGPSDM